MARTTIALCAVLCAAPAGAAEISVTLWDKPDGTMGITTSAPSVAAGPVTFKVTNSSAMLIHEMVVVRLTPEQAAHPDALPYDATAREVEEEDVDGISEVAELDPGKGGELSVTLAAGSYELICNVAGHFMNGMRALLSVK